MEPVTIVTLGITSVLLGIALQLASKGENHPAGIALVMATVIGCTLL